MRHLSVMTNLFKVFAARGTSSFQKALSQARMLSNPYEEAKAIAHLGRLALQVKDYTQALVKLQQALAAMSRLGAMYDALALYQDLGCLFSAQGDHARAEEMAAIREHEAERLGFTDQNVIDLADVAKHVEHAGCLQLSCHEVHNAAAALDKKEKGNPEELPELSPVQLLQSRTV